MNANNHYTPYPTIRQAWGIFGVLILAQLVCSPILMIFGTDSGLGLFLTYTLAWLIGLAFALFHKSRMINDLDPVITADGTLKVYALIEHKAVPLWIYIMGVSTLPAIMMISGPIVQLLPIPDQFLESLKDLFNKDMNVFHFLTLVISAPLLEETIFRGVILDGFLRRYSPKKAILYSAFLFAFMHMNPVQFPHTMLLGTFLGWLYYRTQSIWPCICIHMINNGFVFFLTFVTKDSELEASSDSSLWVLLMVLLIGIFLTYAMVLWISSYLSERTTWKEVQTEEE